MAAPRSRPPTVPVALTAAAVVALACALLLELGARAVFAPQAGAGALLYGTPWGRGMSEVTAPDPDHTVQQHDNLQRGYSKYHPHQRRRDHDEHGQGFDVTINGRGFRGPEFAPTKSPGALRVITLGSSSTFGYHNRDDQTYPYYLARLLEEACGDVEVLNLGIPHLEAHEIASLYEHEAAAYGADVVTFYEGINDSSAELGASATLKQVAPVAALYRTLREHLFVVALADALRARRDDALPPETPAEQERRAQRFLGGVARVHDAARRHGATLVVATQQAKSYLVPEDTIRGVTYAEEVARVQAALTRTGQLDFNQRSFLAHDHVMAALRTWAAARGVPLADVIAATDRDRDVLSSWVHLRPRGNEMVARALADTIIATACSDQRRTNRAMSAQGRE